MLMFVARGLESIIRFQKARSNGFFVVSARTAYDHIEVIAWSRRRCGTALALAALVMLLGSGTARTARGLPSTDPELTVVVSGPGEVTVAPANLTCSSSCTVSVPAGTEVTLKASSTSGSVFTAWQGACAGAHGDTCVLRPDSDTTVTAVFALPRIRTTSTTSTETQPAPTTATTQPPPTPTTTTTTISPPLPTRPPGPHGPVWASIESVAAKLGIGSVAFNAPETLARGETAGIELLLSPDQSVNQLKAKITEAGSREGARVQISDYMRAELTGRSFAIVRIGNEGQLVLPGRTTRWAWDITPTRTGVLHLHLTLTAVLRIDGEDRELDIETFDRTLTIRVALSVRVKDFVHDNWRWLWTSIFVPVGLWAVRRRQTKTKDVPPPIAT